MFNFFILCSCGEAIPYLFVGYNGMSIWTIWWYFTFTAPTQRS